MKKNKKNIFSGKISMSELGKELHFDLVLKKNKKNEKKQKLVLTFEQMELF